MGGHDHQVRLVLFNRMNDLIHRMAVLDHGDELHAIAGIGGDFLQFSPGFLDHIPDDVPLIAGRRGAPAQFIQGHILHDAFLLIDHVGRVLHHVQQFDFRVELPGDLLGKSFRLQAIVRKINGDKDFFHLQCHGFLPG